VRRREFITLLGSAATWPLVARAQQPKRVRRVGALMPQAANDPQVQERNAAFLQGLQQLGWTVGQNLQIDYRWAGGNEDDTRKYAVELVALAPDSHLHRGQCWCRAITASDAHSTDRVYERPRSGWCRLRR
jgi:putative ABC transport system substrate-binding protein